MANLVRKVLLFFVGCFIASIIYANEVYCDTLRLVKRDVQGEYCPLFMLYSDITMQYPTLRVSFDPADRGSGPYFTTMYNSHGYWWTPINFEASAYNFKFGEGINGIMNVDGKIVCKEELKVAEISTERIKAKSIDVDMNHAADYVFGDNYELKSLSDVEAYVKENKHLPGIPSAEDFSEKGMNVSDMTNLLLEKIEELTLHVIQLQKEVETLKSKVEK